MANKRWVQIEVKGLEKILTDIAKIDSKVSYNTHSAIAKRTKALHRDVVTTMSGPAREDISKKGRSSGTGREIGEPGRPTIGRRSGRLLRMLKEQSPISLPGASTFSGEIGFPSAVVSNPGRVKRYALNWPRKALDPGTPVDVGHTPAKNKQPSRELPQKYAEEVILGAGDSRIAGRNVLRMALVRDIVLGLTRSELIRHIRAALKIGGY